MDGLKHHKLNIVPLERRLMLDASLPVIAGQILWLDGADGTTLLDADGDNAATGTGGSNDGFSGSVAAWRDKSTNNHHVEQTNASRQPTLTTSNGLSALNFAGNGDFLEDDDAENYLAGLSGFTIFTVIDSDAASTDRGIFITDVPDGSDDILSIRYDNAGFSGGGNDVLKAGVSVSGSSTSMETSNNSATASPQLISMSWQSGSAIDLDIDGADDIPTAASATRTGVTDAITTLMIGKGTKDSAAGNSWDGKINEFIIYDRELTSTERSNVEIYLAGKWGIAINGNIPPTVDTLTGVTVDEGNTVTVTNSNLAASDPEGVVPSDWFDTDWQYRNQITIDATHIDSNLTDFTMLIDESGLGMDFWSNVQNDGGDIVITTADGTTKLARELVNIDTTAQTMELHTRIPSVSSTVDTNLFIYYGNTTANEMNDATTTFSNYSHVYHMDNLNAVDVIAANNGTHTSGGSITTGIMGGGHLYTGSGLVDITDINGSNIRTLSFWYNPANTGGGNFGSILGSNSFNDGLRHVGTDELNVRDGGSVVVSTSNTFNTDKHLVFSYDSGTGNLNIYENGLLQDSNSFGGWHDVSYLIGIAGNNSRAPGGLVDEIRISNNTLDIHWAAAEFANQSNPSTFYNVSAQETSTSAPVFYTLTANVTNGTLFLDANGNNVADGSEALTVSNTFTQDDIDNNRLKYTHDDSETSSDSFTFTLADGTVTLSPRVFNFVINPVNDQTPTDINLSATSINENSSNGTAIGILSAIDADLPSDSFTFTVQSDPDNKFQIIGNELRVNGSLDREADANHFVAIRVSDGLFTYDESFTITVNDVNENPTDINLSATSINENSNNGTIIGTLGAIDPDLPGDTFTFSIVSDPDDKFQIIGNQLLSAGSVDFEAKNAHIVTIRTDDNNGGTFDRTFTINVLNLSDDTVIMRETDNRVDIANAVETSRVEQFSEDTRLEQLQDSGAQQSIVMASLSGEINQYNAYYGNNGGLQILREKTTLDIAESINIPAAIQTAEPATSPQQADDNARADLPDDNDSGVAHYTNLRQALAFLQDMDRQQQMDTQDMVDQTSQNELEQQFQDVMTYHQQKQSALREALMG